MKRLQKILLLLPIIISVYLFTNCDKDEHLSKSNKSYCEFCEFINAEDFDSTRVIINCSLSDLKTNLSDEKKLEKLCIWLKSMDCVLDVQILCISCIETLPGQSELAISFTINGEIRNLIMDISMGEPLTFVGYHEPYS